MKYTIQRKRLPNTKDDQIYTLIVFLGATKVSDSGDREIRVQYPISSQSEGLSKYREIRHLQRQFEQGISEVLISDSPGKPLAFALNDLVCPLPSLSSEQVLA